MKLSGEKKGAVNDAVKEVYVYKVSAEEALQRGKLGDWSYAMYMGAAAAVYALAAAIGPSNS